MRLDYKHKKWDRQVKQDIKVWDQMGGFAPLRYIEGKTEATKKKLSKERDYQTFYYMYSSEYDAASESVYLRDIGSQQVFTFTYLSGRAAIMERMFAVLYKKNGKEVWNEEAAAKQFNDAIFKMIAVNQPLPKCIDNVENIYVQLLNGNIQNVEKLLLEDNYNLDNLFGTRLDENRCRDIQAIIQRDEKALKEQLINRIKEDRREPIDYFRIIDIYSVGMIKLARRYEMDIDIDVIEIPKMFVGENQYSIDKSKEELPFFEEAVADLQKSGIEFDA